MSDFIIRVELHNATATDYSNLHSAMETAGFSRTIMDSRGILYQLPTAEYVCSPTTQTVNDIRDIAYRIAGRVRPDPSVIAANYTGAAWNGLARA